MIERIVNRKEVEKFFHKVEDTLILTYLEGGVGVSYADSTSCPSSAAIYACNLAFLAGEANEELVKFAQEAVGNYIICMPSDEKWDKIVEKVYGERAKKYKCYKFKQDYSCFDKKRLEEIAASLDDKYRILPVDGQVYEKIISYDWTEDLCRGYADAEEFEKKGFGFVLTEGEKIIAGSASFSTCDQGVEVGVDVHPDYRGKGLSKIVAAKMVLETLNRGLWPHWDAHGEISAAVAQSLGYVLEDVYYSYEIHI